MKNKTATIIVATHKKYRMPKDTMYLPMLVGAVFHKKDYGYAKDDFGIDNISNKNQEFCELTGLYSAWKSLASDYIGLVHYRRYFLSEKYDNPLERFKLKKQDDKFRAVLTYKQLSRFIPAYKIILPKKRKYYVETLYSHYAHTHYGKHLDMTRDIIREISPTFLKSFDRVMVSRSGYMFNMMIMTKDLMRSYCSWLFPILFKLEERLSGFDDNLSDFQARLYGRVSELLFNVWLDRVMRKGLVRGSQIKELPVVYMGEVDYIRKATSFIKAKLFGKKYKSSF